MLRASDIALIAVARSLILARFESDRHAVGCALRTRSGRVHAGVHLECNVGRIAVCAEAVAIGRAATEGDGHDIETIVAVYCAAAGVEPVVAAPCGMCREMISDYAPAARVLISGADGPRVVRVSRLLPGKFARRDAPTLYPDVGAVHGSDGLWPGRTRRLQGVADGEPAHEACRYSGRIR